MTRRRNFQNVGWFDDLYEYVDRARKRGLLYANPSSCPRHVWLLRDGYEVAWLAQFHCEAVKFTALCRPARFDRVLPRPRAQTRFPGS